MGADYLGVRDCTPHRTLGVEDFLAAVKASAVVLAMSGLEAPSLDIAFPKAGLDECDKCPISGGTTLGCYRYVHYPVDADFERQLFAYFVAMQGEGTADYVAATDASGRALTAGQLLREFVVAEIGEDTPWANRRGSTEAGGLASLPEPLRATAPDGAATNSAVVLHATFHPIDADLTLQLYAWFYRDLFRWLESQAIPVIAGSTLDEVRSVAKLLVAAATCLGTEPIEVQVSA